MKTEKEALLYVKNLLVEAIDAMHETGDIESQELDDISSQLVSLKQHVLSCID